jgi:hypothetical protein
MPDYIALQSIQLNGVYAHHAGDVVPADNVERLGYEVGVQVAEVGSQQANDVLAGLGGGTAGYDPMRYSVDQVNEHLDSLDDEQEKARILQAERDTQHRRGILEGRHAANVPAEEEQFDPANPGQYTVDKVNAHLNDHPEDAAQVLAAERGDQQRKGIVEGPHAAAMPAPDVAEL